MVCCEFGAWDGIHLSNCRNLIERGWTALMIEGDRGRFKDLVSNYASNPKVICENRFVDAGANSLGSILRANHLTELDFLSIDIDGLDYEIFETLDVLPRVICIEVNAGHSPESGTRLDRDVAMHNVGQPLPVFVSIAEKKGYQLVCYNGNAFFVRSELAAGSSLPMLTGLQAYRDFLAYLSRQEREWLYIVNLGVVDPHRRFSNPLLTKEALGLSLQRAIWLRSKGTLGEAARGIKRALRKLAGG